MKTYVYILHFDTPLGTGNKTSRHYIGSTADVPSRMRQHANGTGARIMEVCHERGITFTLAHVYTESGHYKLRCPLCRGETVMLDVLLHYLGLVTLTLALIVIWRSVYDC